MATNGTTRVSRKGRPNYPIEFKRDLAARACEPGTSVAKLALEHGVNANLLFKWRREHLRVASAPAAATLLPVCVGPESTAASLAEVPLAQAPTAHFRTFVRYLSTAPPALRPPALLGSRTKIGRAHV